MGIIVVVVFLQTEIGYFLVTYLLEVSTVEIQWLEHPWDYEN